MEFIARLLNFLPIPLRLYVAWLAMTTLIQIFLRLGFTLYFATEPLNFGLLLQSLWLGARFDLRLGAFIWMLPLLFITLSRLGLRIKQEAKVVQSYIIISGSALLFVYAVDWAHFSYLQARLNANLVFLLANPQEALGTVWQTYPVIRLVLGCAAAVWLWQRAFVAVYQSLNVEPTEITTPVKSRWRNAAWAALGVAMLIAPIFGRFNQYPLRWSDLYFTPNLFYVSVATNPVLNFFDTYRYAKKAQPLSTAELSPHLLRMRQFLTSSSVDFAEPEIRDLNEVFVRNVKANTKGISTQPNVVLIYLESFSGYKTTTFGNPLNPTPFFDSLAQSGTLFTHFYTAHAGTARGVFAGMTGVADVELADTASRNPLYAKQNMLVNQLDGYERMYFIGGSLSWANVRGTLRNIHGLRTYEEENFATPRTDVWGLSDHDLFREANQVLAKEKRPFFAVIQTASNHRPYTIPESDKDFVRAVVPDEKLHQHGFQSIQEYNGFRYLDYSLKKFFELAQKEPYFDNTIFVMMGDHGISGSTGPHMPKAYSAFDLSQIHTPLLMYAPKLIAPQKVHAITQQVDVLPTILGRLNKGYQNAAVGRDAFDTYAEHYGFMINHSAGPELTLFDDQYLLRYNMTTKKSSLHRYLDTGDIMLDLSSQKPDVAQRMQEFVLAYYQSTRFRLGHASAQAAY